MLDLPTGTVTLLFTDIEGSTHLLQELGRERYVDALTIHRRLLRETFTANGGVEVEMQGDSFHFSFRTARDAVQAAAAGQRALGSYEWPTEPIRVRIGLHTGEPVVADDLYAGLDVHRAARVMSASHGGQVLLSGRTADLVVDEPPDGLLLLDLGEHRLKDLLEPQRLYQLAGEGLAEDFPPLKTLPVATTNLPVVSTPLIGRERELQDLIRLIAREDVRLLTLSGPGGIGKTRLALQVTADSVDSFAGGAYWVPFAAVRDPELVLPGIGQAIGAEGEIADHLRGRETLVLLDNLEHLLGAAGSLADLLTRVPELRLLVTSRSPLHINSEHEYPLDPLPDDGAVTLFVERARRAGASIEPSEAVREICRRLDNLPLAVELAAGRAKLLGADVLLARLERRLPLLTGGRRDLPERQRTLRATIEWSYELLPGEAKEPFSRLSVFAGTFSLEAAEDVCQAGLDALAELADLSLLKPTGDGRFVTLETIREYASERLESLGKTEVLRDRHARFFLALAEDAYDRAYSAGQAELFARLADERDNLRAALDHLHQKSPVLELRLAGALQDFWIARGEWTEGRNRLESALAASVTAPPAARVRALEGAAWVASLQGDELAAESYGNEALAVARAIGDARRTVSALSVLGSVEVRRGQYAPARRLFDEALELARSTGDDMWITLLLGHLSDLALNEGAFDDVMAFASECLARAEAAGDTWTMTIGLQNLGLAALHRGDPSAAAYLARSIPLAREVGARHTLGTAVEAVAALVAAQRPDASARLVGAVQAALGETKTPLHPFEAGMHERTLEILAQRLGSDGLEVLLREESRLELDDAATLARDLALSAVPSPARGPAL